LDSVIQRSKGGRQGEDVWGKKEKGNALTKSKEKAD